MRQILALLLLGFTAPAIAADSPCYEYTATYSQAHMRTHPHQSLKSIRVSLDSFSAGDSPSDTMLLVHVEGVSARDNRIYEFEADEKVASNVICASIQEDGDQQSGCIKITPSAKGIFISPVAMKYQDPNGAMTARGIDLLRCAGRSTDGEGCEAGKLRTVVLSPKNPDDLIYSLTKSLCK